MGGQIPVPPTVFLAQRCLLPPLLSLLHRPRAPQPPRGGLGLLGAGGHPGGPRQAPLQPTPGTDGRFSGAPAAHCPDPHPPYRALSVPSLLPPPGTGWGRREHPQNPPFPLGCTHRGPSAAEAWGRRSPSPVTPGRKEGRSTGRGHRDAVRDQGGALCPGGGAPVPPDRALSPRPGAPGPQGPALPGRCRAGSAAEGNGRRRRRLRGGQGRRCLRPGPLHTAAAGAGADRERGLRSDRVRLPGRGWLHEPAREPRALLRLQPQRGRLSLRHRHRHPRLPRVHLLLHGGRLFPPDQQHYRPQVPGPGRPRLLRSLDFSVVHRLLFPDQPVVLDTDRGCVHRSRFCPCCHHLQLLLHLLLGSPAHLRLQEVQNGGGGLCSKLCRPQPGSFDSLLKLSQHQPRELPAAALHADSRGPGGLSATTSVLSPGWHPRHGCTSAIPSAGWEGGV